MAFTNDASYEDDFRKVGEDATADFERPGSSSNPTEYASSGNVEVVAKADEADDLEDDEEDEDDLEDDDDLDVDDDDLEDEDDEDEDIVDDEDDDDDEDEEDDDEDEEESDTAVMARLGDAEKTVRAR